MTLPLRWSILKVTEEHQENGKLKSSATTQLVSQIVLSGGRTISYEYDEEERITKVVDSVDGTTEYAYDALGQLLTEKKNGVSKNTMTYDRYGNIQSKNDVVYTYGDDVWKDKLTAVGNQTISYDAQGNPISYLGHTLTWEKGRQLKSFDNISYTYNANGIRTSKTVNGVTHTYTLDGSKILQETRGGNVLNFLYDNEDSVCGLIYNGTPYYYLKNLQGDIIAIADANGSPIARYTYDAWGKCTIAADSSACNIATINPFRYRGYYFDDEIGVYYLQSRYYDPKIGRFLNVDDAIELTFNGNSISYNLHTYCQNNPINEVDLFGKAIGSLILKIIAGILCGFVSQLFSDLLKYFTQCIFVGKNKAALKCDSSDYISSMISWVLDFINPFKSYYIINKLISSFTPFAAKYGWKLIRGYRIDRKTLWEDLFWTVIPLIISLLLKGTEKNSLNRLRKKRKSKNYIKLRKITIKKRFKVLGEKIDIYLPISEYLVGVIYDCVMA